MAFGRTKQNEWDGTERRAPASVLVVNDDEHSAKLLSKVLTRRGGFRSEAASDTRATLAAMRQHLPRCVVIDIRSGGSGANLKVLEAIRGHEDRRISSTRVVMCASTPGTRSFSFQSGADAFVTRPFHADELVETVHEVLTLPDAERSQRRRIQLDRVLPRR
jgi:DNA-binding NtrC family response regulator